MADFEKYVNDQFPLRDQWIQLKAWSERLLGKQENNKVYFGTDGQTLFAQFNALPDEALAERVDYVNQLADNVIVRSTSPSSQTRPMCGRTACRTVLPGWTTAPLWTGPRRCARSG